MIQILAIIGVRMISMYCIGTDLPNGAFLVHICDSQIAATQKASYNVRIDTLIKASQLCIY